MQFPVLEYTTQTHEIVDTGGTPDFLFSLPYKAFILVELGGSTSQSGTQNITGSVFWFQTGSGGGIDSGDGLVILCEFNLGTSGSSSAPPGDGTKMSSGNTLSVNTDGFRFAGFPSVVPANENIYMAADETGNARDIIFHIWRLPDTV